MVTGSAHRKATAYTKNSINIRQTSMTSVGFEPMTPAVKTVHALDHAATLIGPFQAQKQNRTPWPLVRK
jgi:hypothetical protein